MRLRKIKHIVDAMARQGRVIVQLECGHNMSVTEADLETSPLLLVHATERGEFRCTTCPDAAPATTSAKEEFNGLFKENY